MTREIEAADEVGNMEQMAQCVRRLSGNSGRSCFTIQPDADEDLEVRADSAMGKGRGTIR